MHKKQPFILGLTGSIGMGKSTTAGFFKEFGVPVWDADAAVHRLYGQGGPAVAPISERLPNVIQDGAVDRGLLKIEIAKDPSIFSFLETIVHPLVAEDRRDFIASASAPIIVLDIPLLFELGSEGMMDAVLVVSAPSDEQRKRVLERGTMNEQEFEAILARQLPDEEKRKRADYVIETIKLDQAKTEVQLLIEEIESK